MTFRDEYRVYRREWLRTRHVLTWPEMYTPQVDWRWDGLWIEVEHWYGWLEIRRVPYFNYQQLQLISANSEPIVKW